MKEFKPKVSMTQREQFCREILIRVFNEETYSKEFIEGHIQHAMPKLHMLLVRREEEMLAYLADRLLRHAVTCELDGTKFHLPSNDSKLRNMFNAFVEGWKDTD